MRSKVIAALTAGINAANLGVTAYPETCAEEIEVPCVIVRMESDEPIEGLDGCGVRDTTITFITRIAGEHTQVEADSAGLLNTEVLDLLDTSGEDFLDNANVTVSGWEYMGSDYAPDGSCWQWTQRWKLIVCDNLDGD